MTYRSNKYMHLNSATKAHGHRVRNKKVKRPRNPVAGERLQKKAKQLRKKQARKKLQQKLQKGVFRIGDQWATGKNTYRKLRATLSEECVGRWLAVAQGGVDIIGEPGETREDFERRVTELVKAHEQYTPYIVKHRLKGQQADDDDDDDDVDEEEEEEEEEEEGEGGAMPLDR
eukprot:EG_transcript_34625